MLRKLRRRRFPFRAAFATAFLRKARFITGTFPWLSICLTAGMTSAKVKVILYNIVNERKRLGLTQEYMGYKMGISQNAYSKIELGYSALTVNQLIGIAAIFNCGVEELLKE